MSDDEDHTVSPMAHKDMLHAISMLSKTQHIRKATRNEPKKQQDEFQLMKGAAVKIAAPSARVGVQDIVKVLKKTTKHLNAGKQLKNVQSTKKKLAKPLEKPEAQRIKRTIGYEKTKKTLGRWDAVVAKNRSAEQQFFPLANENVYLSAKEYSKPLQMSIKSDAMREMEAVEARLKEFRKLSRGEPVEDEAAARAKEERLLQQKMTRRELQARRQELTQLKMRESQKSAKARLQNKIKSKKYHKLLKKQKIQQQMKEFELLQKTDPEAALQKLDEFEKNRVMERASLRHKNTGTWAKNLQVRAKYDQEVRRDLAEQLQISRELTQKKTQDEDDDSDEDQFSAEAAAKEMEQEPAYDPFNPWMRAAAAKAAEEGDGEGGESWRKYWLERNKNEKALQAWKDDKAKAQESDEEMSETEKLPSKPPKKGKKQNKGKLKTPIEMNETPSTSTQKSKNIDDIFDDHENDLREKLNSRLAKLEEAANKKKQKKKQVSLKNKKKVDELKTLKDLEFKNTHKTPIIDEELGVDSDDEQKTATKKLKLSTKNSNSQNTAATAPVPKEDVIDPNQLADVILRTGKQELRLRDGALDDAGFDEDSNYDSDGDEREQQKMTLMEAFEDDDIVADFQREKKQDTELKGAEISLFMPGWGSWAGAGISKERTNRKNKLILNLAQKAKEDAQAARKDSGKESVYINEDVGKHLRAHMVSDLPFPFTTTQEFEASMRTPAGREFMPQTAFRVLNRPAVVTRKGQIIEAMDESELVKRKVRRKHVVDRRIEREMRKVASGK